jgi:hypothetical protein
MCVDWRALVWVAIGVLVTLTLSGCGGREPEMTSGEAREQLDKAVKAITSATGEDWEVDAEPGLLGCSRTHGQWSTSWNGSPTADRESSYAAVRDSLEDAGFTTYILGPRSTTPSVGSQTEGGGGLVFSMPVEGGPIGFDVSSDCFLEDYG